MTEPVWLLKSAVLAVHNMMIARFGGTTGIRDEGLLDSALARPVDIYQYDSQAVITADGFLEVRFRGNERSIRADERSGP